MELFLITGQSGAGKTKAVDALEDRGVFCVDNVPPKLIPSFAEMASQSGKIQQLAMVTDARTGEMFDSLLEVTEELKKKGIEYKLLFLQCSDDVLERRYRETRRRHPLQKDRRYSVKDAIQKESEMLKKAYELADYHIDTTFLSVAQLKQIVNGLFDDVITFDSMTVRCISFGFKYGVPTEADIVYDVRCLPNPFYVPELKELSGQDQEIVDWLWAHDETKEFVDKLLEHLLFSLPLYKKEGKSQLVIAVGCTGGRHRSVAIAECIRQNVIKAGYDCDIIHRDTEKSSK